jgi:hypothetical protein
VSDRASYPHCALAARGSRRVEAVADRYEDTADSQIASDLYAAELTMSARAVDKAIAALDDLARS